MSEPKKTPYQGIPVGRMLVILCVFGVLGLGLYGGRELIHMVKLTNFPITGEWQASGKPWRIEFRADKTLVSAQLGDSQAPAPETGTYKVDYFGNLWVMLKSGRTYSAALAPIAGELTPPTPNRFDLIDTTTDNVTVFERVLPEKPKAP
ncbi:MAG TPA: hypothetical protein VL996_09920 [Methylocella sp.]|nr:hypothetical protein [Methylocella sp.]